MKRIRALRDMFLRMSVMGGGGDEKDPRIVKAKIPHSWFTQKGPGVERETRRAFSDMNHGQKLIAISRGWIPEHWLRRR